MHQINNIIVDLDEVSSIKQTEVGLEFNVKNGTLTARGARFSDLVNAVDVETFLDAAIKIKSECGLRIAY